jgi:hypothetical protein
MSLPEYQTGDIDLEACFAASQTGKGCPLGDIASLKRFADYVRPRNAVVCNLETFEVRGEDQVMRMDLSIYAGGLEDQRLPSEERIRNSLEALSEVTREMQAEGCGFVFIVWSDDLRASPPTDTAQGPVISHKP